MEREIKGRFATRSYFGPKYSAACKAADIQKDQITTTCFSDRGRFYQGGANVTRSGVPCQSWSQQAMVIHVVTNKEV
ncbi:Muscle, skeletal receptor tyrosine protein kinase [Liparis tanakae]|uniref:Muscle, skeletal receptor tyrosine protein kinase n=1 Tax=Liparis tanakae TaxID=230148 RepID=A0A4Z2EE05_9TELE|nr:Muscle, skeletal receptor tyrosine protein kinase [Liparis tanakae]